MFSASHILRRCAICFATGLLFICCFTFRAGAAQSGVVDGDNVRLRSEASASGEVLTVLDDGAIVTILGSEGDWLSVAYTADDDTLYGYVSGDFICVKAELNESGTTRTAIANETTMFYSDADARQILSVVNAGEYVIVIDSTSDETYTQVQYNGCTGYVAAAALSEAILANGTSVSYSVPVRAEASVSAEILLQMSADTPLEILSDDGAWYQIRVDGVTGYVRHAAVIVDGDDSFVGYGTTTDTVYLRSEASTSGKKLSRVSRGVTFQILSETDGWYEISYNDNIGYVCGDYVDVSKSTTSGYIRVSGESVALMGSACADAAVLAELEEDTTLTVIGNMGRWYCVAYEGYIGYVSNTDVTTVATALSGSSAGAAVVEYAVQFLGNRYVYGGSSLTNGTDCSGFVMSVYAYFGVSLPHSSYAMRSCGTAVSVSDIQPGDIVCYSGHVGIYAGNGQIINAANASTGIVYTDLNYSHIISVRRIFN